MITEDYVSFETAKLLKEKGFDEATYHDYNTTGARWFESVNELTTCRRRNEK